MYTQPEPFTQINDFGEVSCPFIAPDESYIIFQEVVNGQGYMYISFRLSNDQWHQPERITQIPPNIPCSFVSRDGEYLFVNDYWISAEIIEDYRPQNEELIIEDADPAVDIDGNIYKAMKIGNQTWMVENYKVTQYNDGSQIPYVWGNTSWNDLKTPAYCWPNNDISNKQKYGGLYNWYVVNSGKLAFTGWHIPSNNEWIILINYLGGINNAGAILQEAGIISFSGFLNPQSGQFLYFDYLNKYWTNTINDVAGDVFYWNVCIDNTVGRSSHPKESGHAVICIKN